MRHWSGALKLSVSLAMMSAPLTAAAEPVTFWYGGVVTTVVDENSKLPFPVKPGMLFSGRIRFDGTAPLSAKTNVVTGGSYSLHYFNDTDGYSTLLQMAGHHVENVTRKGSFAGLILAGDQHNNEDSYEFQTGGGTEMRLDGAPFTPEQQFSLVTLSLADASKTALNGPGLPSTAPDLSKFVKRRLMTWGLYIDDGKPTRVYSVNGTLTTISTNELVWLQSSVPAPGILRLAWPKLNTGFILQERGSLTAGNWSTVTNAVVEGDLEFSVTMTNSPSGRFFRLKK